MSTNITSQINTAKRSEAILSTESRAWFETDAPLPRQFGVVDLSNDHGVVSATSKEALAPIPKGAKKEVYWLPPDESGDEALVIVQSEVVYPAALERGEFRTKAAELSLSELQARFLEHLADLVEEALPDLREIVLCADFDQILGELIATLAIDGSPVELTEWVEKYHLEVDWIREVAHTTLLVMAVAQQEGETLPKRFSIGRVQPGKQPESDSHIRFEATWNPFEESIEEAERRLMARFRTEVRFRMERRAADLDTAGYSRTLSPPGNSDKRITEAREMDIQWLVLFQCEGVSWESLAGRFPTNATPRNRRDDIRKRAIRMASELGITLRTRT